MSDYGGTPEDWKPLAIVMVICVVVIVISAILSVTLHK